MRASSDMELVGEYARTGSEAAFGELVQRHVNLVFSAALRHVGIAALAEEITQAVFIILARKAAKLREDTVIEAWLYETTRLASLSFLRGEFRRQAREQEAYMQTVLQESTAPDAVWSQIAPQLDDAMAKLGGKEREAVVLRFFKEKNLREIAAGLNISEAAAQKRVNRALEKLRKFFLKRGVNSTTVILAGAISANSVHAAPVGLAATISATALKGPAAAASTLALVKGTLKVMAWLKAKTLIVIGAGAVLTGAAVLTLHAQEEKNRSQEQAIRATEQQIRTQEQDPNLSPAQRQQLEKQLNEMRAKQNALRASQNQLREKDPNAFAHPSAHLSPFTKVRYDGDKVFVTFEGTEYELAAINGVATTGWLDFCNQHYGSKLAQKRFAEDLVVVLADNGHPASADNCVSLVLVDSKTGEKKTVDHATMTEANRQAVYEALPPEQR